MRFSREVDDPKGVHAEQILAVPIYCSTDRLDTSMHSLSSIPRGIISLINKKDPAGFTPKVFVSFLIFIIGHWETGVP